MDEMEFKKLFLHAAGLYPGSQTHEGTAASYFAHLRSFPDSVLRVAFREACKGSPQFLPTAPKIREHAERVAKSAVAARVPPSRQLEGPREYVPPVGAGAEEWVNAATSPGEKLARLWSVESKAAGWDRAGQVPEEVGRARWKQLLAVLNGSHQETTNGPRQTGTAGESAPNGSRHTPGSGTSSGGGLSHGADCVCETCFAGAGL